MALRLKPLPKSKILYYYLKRCQTSSPGQPYFQQRESEGAIVTHKCSLLENLQKVLEAD